MWFSATGFNRTDVVNWGGKALVYRYHPNSETADYATLYDFRHEHTNS